MRIAICGGSSLLRHELSAQLTGHGQAVVADVARPGLLAAAVRTRAVDVVLLDATGPESPGRRDGRRAHESLAAAIRLRLQRPDLPVLFLVDDRGEAVIAPAVATVADLDVLRADDVVGVASLIGSLGRVARGVTTAPAPRSHRPPPGGGRRALTAGETAVLGLMAQGYSNAGIAGLLSLSHKTVECHVSRVFDKLELHPVDTGLNRRVLAVLWWVERSHTAQPARPVAVRSTR